MAAFIACCLSTALGGGCSARERGGSSAPSDAATDSNSALPSDASDVGIDGGGVVDAASDDTASWSDSSTPPDGLVCEAGRGNCDGFTDNGCEVELAASNAHCGACGSSCDGSEVCRGGQCVCAPGFHDCGGTCESDTDVEHCGLSCIRCEAPPNAIPLCIGACDFRCDDGFDRVGDACHARPAPAWSAHPSGTTAILADVWGSGPTDIYAVGNAVVDVTILHSDGSSSWTLQTTPGPTPRGYGALWGSGSTDIYAAGAFGMIIRSDGQGVWTQETSGVMSWLLDLWGSGPSHVYAVGDAGVILHSAGDGLWTPETSGVNESLRAIWGSGAHDVYAIGSSGIILRSAGDGMWTPEVSGTDEILTGIWGSGAGDVYAVGWGGTILHSTGGGAWSPQASTSSENLNGIWGSAANDVYAVGENGTLLHSAGNGTWMRIPIPGPLQPDLNAIWGSDGARIYAVGNQGTIRIGP